MSYEWPKHVAVLSEDRGFALELAQAIVEGFRSHNCEVDLLGRNDSWKQEYDFVLGYGPHTWEGSLLPAARQLESCPKDKRPFFYWWYTEAAVSSKIPVQVVKILSGLHTKGNLWLSQSPEAREKLWVKKLDKFFLRRHFRLRVIGELYEFYSRGLLSGLAVTADSRVAYLRRHGFRPVGVPIGYHPLLHGRDLGLRRDIDIGFLGRMHTKRRLRILQKVRKELSSRGIKIVVPDKELNGEERTRFLNRTKIILNIFQKPGDFHGLRFLFCAANKTLLVSEPVLDREPFVPGRYMVTAPVEQLARTIEFYLSQQEKRRQIVEQAHRLISEEFTMHRMIGRILSHSRQLYLGQRNTPPAIH
ncbi:MAG: glycosyltransferase family 1 protein [Sedimentisphaerales bacterium]|nr:glycosyltransferase family 1 protein [Sedimentisphaerales bacterium]